LGGQATSQTFTFSPDSAGGQHNGTIGLVNGATTATYTYSNLSPVLVNAGTPTDVVFNLPTGDGDNQAILEASPPAGESQIRSGNGTFETTTFANPTTSLTINTGDDGETVTIATPDSAFAAPVTVNGGTGNDTFNVTPSANFAVTVNGNAPTT